MKCYLFISLQNSCFYAIQSRSRPAHKKIEVIKEVCKCSKPRVCPEKQSWQAWCWLQLISRPPWRKWNNAPLCFVEVGGTGGLHSAADLPSYVSSPLTLPSDGTAAGPPLLLDSNTHLRSTPTHASHCLGFCVPTHDLSPPGRFSARLLPNQRPPCSFHHMYL